MINSKKDIFRKVLLVLSVAIFVATLCLIPLLYDNNTAYAFTNSNEPNFLVNNVIDNPIFIAKTLSLPPPPLQPQYYYAPNEVAGNSIRWQSGLKIWRLYHFSNIAIDGVSQCDVSIPFDNNMFNSTRGTCIEFEPNMSRGFFNVNTNHYSNYDNTRNYYLNLGCTLAIEGNSNLTFRCVLQGYKDNGWSDIVDFGDMLVRNLGGNYRQGFSSINHEVLGSTLASYQSTQLSVHLSGGIDKLYFYNFGLNISPNKLVQDCDISNIVSLPKLSYITSYFTSYEDKTIYDNGYNSGFNAGNQEGYDNGYEQAKGDSLLNNSPAYDKWYNLGYKNGLDIGDQNNFTNLFSAILFTPVNVVFGQYDKNTGSYDGGVFNLKIPLGDQTLDISNFVKGLVTVCIIAFVVRYITAAKND